MDITLGTVDVAKTSDPETFGFPGESGRGTGFVAAL